MAVGALGLGQGHRAAWSRLQKGRPQARQFQAKSALEGHGRAKGFSPNGEGAQQSLKGGATASRNGAQRRAGIRVAGDCFAVAS